MLHRRLWMQSPSGHDHTLEPNFGEARGHWFHQSYNFVPVRCVAAKLGRTDSSSTVQQLELVWRQYTLHPTLWSDRGKDKPSSCSLDFERQENDEPMWPDNSHKPSWLDGQLAVMDHRTRGPCKLTINPWLHHPATAASMTDRHDGTTEAVILRVCETAHLRGAVDAVTVLAKASSIVLIPLLSKLIRRCGAEKNLVLGRRLDDLSIRLGYESNAYLGNHILRMYACQGRLEEAVKVLSRVAKPSALMWVSIMSAQVKHGKPRLAIKLYRNMRSSGSKPNCHVFAAALQACGRAGDVESGRQVHADVLKSGLQPESLVVENCLVDMYVKCGELDDARRVFDRMAARDTVSWNSMINGYAARGLGSQALELYATMEQEGRVVANSVTYACLLKACGNVGALQEGRKLHTQIVNKGLLETDVVVGNCLILMYAKCGKLEDARMVFDSLATKDAVTWTVMMNGYSDHGLGLEALSLYGSMEEEGQSIADAITFVCLLKACASAGALQHGRKLHLQIAKRGLLENMAVGSCLVNMYAKCGMLEDAREVFECLTTKTAESWTALINGYAEHGLGFEALTLYARMEQEGLILADSVTFICLLNACATAGALQLGRQLHSQIVERRLLEDNIMVGSSLIGMYAKCGQLEDARMLFDSLATRDVVTWTAMINGYGTNNEGQKAVACFEEMMLAGVEPDSTTFTCLLVACSHEGLVSEGRQYFDAMVKQHGLNPTSEHYVCMADLLGRAGCVDEAEKTLLSGGCEKDAVGLTSLLNACKSHGDVERGRRCFESLVELDPLNASAYVLMANVYVDADRWADADRVETLRKLAGASKKPAVAGIEVKKQVHSFVVGEKRGDISCKVQSTIVRLKEEGNHVPYTTLVLKPLSETEKEDELCGHAEKLALAYGLLNTPEGTPLLVTKNLRMCKDCHASTEIMSRIEKRDIVVRDAHRVHRFEAGFCSCMGRC